MKITNKYILSSIVVPIEFTVPSKIIVAVKAAAHAGADIVELRVDKYLLAGISLDKICAIAVEIKHSVKCGVLLTVRSPKENGMRRTAVVDKKLSDNIRKKAYLMLIKYVDFVDIELSSNKIIREVISRVKKLNKKVVVSYHNFSGTPSNTALSRFLVRGKKFNADIVKLAVVPKNQHDVWRLLNFCRANNNTKPRLAVVSMTSLGTISRILGFIYGSQLTYAYLKSQNASGQVSLKSLKCFYNRLHSI
ncbi:MAG: type I 3-dehydroquinate dehydratase [Elusimicrobiota bacterium]